MNLGCPGWGQILQELVARLLGLWEGPDFTLDGPGAATALNVCIYGGLQDWVGIPRVPCGGNIQYNTIPVITRHNKVANNVQLAGNARLGDPIIVSWSRTRREKSRMLCPMETLGSTVKLATWSVHCHGAVALHLWWYE